MVPNYYASFANKAHRTYCLFSLGVLFLAAHSVGFEPTYRIAPWPVTLGCLSFELSCVETNSFPQPAALPIGYE